MLICWIAVRDWLSDWPLSLCLLATVTSTALPLIVLLSLRAGVVDQMRNELARFPSSRELRTPGQPRITLPLVRALAKRDDVAFAAPLTRLLAANGTVQAKGGNAVTVDLLPSGAGDPLAQGRRRGEVVLSDSAAREAGIKPGGSIRLTIGRIDADGRQHPGFVDLRVAAIAPAFMGGRRIALIDQDLLLAAELYREDPALRSLRDAQRRARQVANARAYAGLRLYARSIDDVDAVRRALLARGVVTEGRFEEIRLLQRLDRATGLVLGILGSLSALGLLVSLGSAQWSWVQRRRADIGYLRLIGFERFHITLMPVVQALLTIAGGLALAAAIALLLDEAIDSLFAGQLAGITDVSRVGLAEISMVGAAIIGTALLASAVASRVAGRIAPAEALRGAAI